MELTRETAIVRDICQWLVVQQSYCFWRSNNIPVPGRAMPKWTPRGLPDIMIVHDGVFWGIEVKRPPQPLAREPNGRKVRGGALTPEQHSWGTNVIAHGGRYFVVHSLDEFKAIFP